MATSVYFNNFQNSGEQGLIEDLVIESIRIYGHDVYYIPRVLTELDKILGEAPLAEFNNQYFLEMYIKNVEGFAGEGDFLSKFNLQIRDQITFTVARRTFTGEVTQYEPAIVRPQEGDLIYFPLNKKIFQIKFVEHEPVFYQMGALQMYDVQCELFEYSGERMNTGIYDIDILERDRSIDLVNYALKTQDGFIITDAYGFPIIQGQFDIDTQAGDFFADNDEIQVESDTFVDFSETDPFSEGAY